MIERLRGTCRVAIVGMASVVLVVGCAGGRAGIEPGSGDGDGSDVLADDEVSPEGDEVAPEGDGSGSDGDFGEPTPEGTTEEAPAEIEIDATTIEVATLPIGGDPDRAGGNLQCVDVGWSDPPEIPTGVIVVIQSLVLEPAEDFELSDQPCPGDAPPCLPDHPVTPEERCLAAVAWTDAAGEGGGSLSASGTIVCQADAETCAAFADAVTERGGESIELLAPPNGTTPPENGVDEDSGPSGQGGEESEDSELNGAGGTPEDGQGDGEEEGEQNGVEDTPENGEG